MKKTFVLFSGIIIGVLLIIALASFFKFNFSDIGTILQSGPDLENKDNNKDSGAGSTLPDPKNISYKINDKEILFKEGRAEIEVFPGSVQKEVFKIFDEPVIGDFDGVDDNDKNLDSIAWVTHETGGSGFFYYVVAVHKNSKNFTGTNAIFVGDRISPQNIDIKNGAAIVNFLDRGEYDSFTEQPSIKKSITIKLDVEKNEISIVQNLQTRIWEWIETSESGIITKPKNPGKFFLIFNDTGYVSIKTDCNSMSANYVENGNSLSFDRMISTKMYCVNSDENYFAAILAQVNSFEITNSGELKLFFGDGKFATFR